MDFSKKSLTNLINLLNNKCVTLASEQASNSLEDFAVEFICNKALR